MSKSSNGPSACMVLVLTLVVLKLCGVVSWSWLWVLSPLWLPLVVVTCLLLVLALGGLFICACLAVCDYAASKRGK